MYKNFILSYLVLISLYYLTNSAQVNVAAYKNEDSNSCNISLDLSDAGLKHLGVNFINSNCVRNLILRNNSIEDFEEGIFNSQLYLEYLDLSRNRLKLHNFFSYGGQSTLKVLILDHNNYYSDNTTETVKEKNNFDNEGKNSDEIKSLENRYNRLNVQHNFLELKYLSLRNVNMNGISEDWINHFPKLNYLDLSENTFSDEMLNFLLKNISSTISHLILENVGLTIVRTESLNNIETLNLNHNYLPRLSSRKCRENTLCLEMDNLKLLSISNCSVTYIEENAFRYMKNLVELNMSKNCFQRIPDKTFSFIPSLTSLDLSRNSLYSMPNIDNLQNLTSLILDEMKIKKMMQTLQTFTYLPKLKFISLRNNQLTSISPNLFNNLPTLEKVDLSNNQITSLSSWDTQKSLRQLDLSLNKIKNLEDLSIKEAKLLELLVLKNNSISQIKLSSLRDLPNNNIILDL